MKIHKNLEQNSEAWFKWRSGRLTASSAQAIASCGKGLETLIKTMAELSSSAEKEQYSNVDLERGKELEDQAREIYSLESGVEVEQVGGIEMDEIVSCSPDGLVEEDGMLEVKCPNDDNFFKIIVFGEKAIDSKYLWQCQMQMLVAQRKWVDLLFYSPNFSQSPIIFRITPDKEKFERLEKGFAIGKKRIQEINQIIK